MKEILYVRTEDRDFEHGEITCENKDHIECNIKANIHLVVSISDKNLFKQELEQLLKRYAL